MINIYAVEKRMEHEKRKIERIANQAWMFPKKKQNRHLSKTLRDLLEITIRTVKKQNRKMYDS